MAAAQGNAGSSSCSSSSVEGAGGAAGDELSGNSREPVAESVPVLQSPPETQASVDAGNGKTVQVTLEEPVEGKRMLTSSWTWHFASRFSPPINGKNVVCMAKKADGTTCKHLIMKWEGAATAAVTGKRGKGSGTSGISKHLETAHKVEVDK
ncbi:unnamed protein product [Ectocarpus sp. CCAP 1310/34]|nr:unnamed protein product [Ectocarpus sp. CCAP 1310/34]